MRRVFTVTVALLLAAVVCSEADDEFEGMIVEDEAEEMPLPVDVDVGVYETPVPSDEQSVYLWEPFDDVDGFTKRWVRSAARKEDTAEDIAKYDGEWSIEPAVRDALPGDRALVLKSKAKHAAIAARLTRPFMFTAGRPLVVQYEVTFQEGQECGGAYLKLVSEGPESKDLRGFRDRTPYTIMFGPDKCGNDHKLHFIFRHVNPLNGSVAERHLTRKPDERIEELFRDKRSHLYTLVVRPEGVYEVRVDGKRLVGGSLLEDFEPPVNPPAEVDDPEDVRPADWDDRERVPEPGAVKPDDWDEDAPPQLPDALAVRPDGWLEDEPATVAEPGAVRPDDWDEEMDGEWEPPQVDNPRCVGAAGCGPWSPPLIANPAYRGKWRPPLVPNPNYRGVWRPRRIPNPNHYVDERPFERLHAVAAVGFELWSMSRDVLFDNVLVAGCERAADELAERTWRVKRRRADREAVSTWGRVMRALGGRPGWWAVYACWCLAPLAVYARHLRRRSRDPPCQESLLTRLLAYADERPWLWAVYVLGTGLPVTLLLYCCCRTGAADRSQDACVAQGRPDAAGDHDEDHKKTDAPVADDPPAHDDDEAEEEQPGEDEEDAEGQQEEEQTPGDERPAAGDAPVRRRVRKE